jgi:hypothetical protein
MAAMACMIGGSLAFCTLVVPVQAAQAPSAETAVEQNVQDVLNAATATDMQEQNPITIEVSYGYENQAKGGRYLPVSVSVANSGGEVTGATLCIRSIESDGEIYQYDFAGEILVQGETQLREYIPLGTRATQLYVSLLDADDTLLAEQQVNLNVSWDIPELFIGILSDEPSELRYLDGVGINHGTMRTRTFELTDEDFPNEEIELNLLDMLVVNNYKLRKLDEQQTAAIMDWVRSGGVLLLGTGDRVDDTLGRFAPELLDDSYDAPNLRFIDLGESFPVEEEGAGMLAVDCVDIPLHGGNVIISSDGLSLFSVAAKERGLIGVAAFDLSEISQFCERETSYPGYLLTNLMGENRIRQLSEVVYSGNSTRYTSVQSLINTGNLEKLPHLLVYVVLIVVYLFAIGPGLYLYLKNRELQIYYRRGIIILSVVFTAATYLVGTMTRFRSTFYTYASILDIDDDYITDTTYVNIRNPYNKPFEVSLNPEYNVLPITRNRKNGGQDSTEISGTEDYRIDVDRREDGLVIRGQNIVAFSPKYFQLERKNINENSVGISGDVDFFEGKLTGSITNNFDYALENAALVLYGNVVFLDRMEAGETKVLDELPVYSYPLDHSQILAEKITGVQDFAKADIGNTDYLRTMKRTSLLKFYLDNYLTGYTADARVIAFSTDQVEHAFLQEDAAETYGLTMMTSEIAVNTSLDDSLYRSVLMKTPNVVTGQYNAAGNSMSGAEPLTLEYQMGTDIRVESLTFMPVSETFTSENQSEEIEAFVGGIYFYNHSSGVFDRMELENGTLDVEQLGPYLSPGNILTVRYVYEGTGSYRAIQLPMPMVAGRMQ